MGWTLGQAAQIDWTSLGIFGVLVAGIALAGLKRKWVFGWVHDSIVAGLQGDLDRVRIERDEWKQMALRLGGMTETVVARAADAVYEAARKSEGGHPT